MSNENIPEIYPPIAKTFEKLELFDEANKYAQIFYHKGPEFYFERLGILYGFVDELFKEDEL